ncbi:legume-like lectin family-domain-containing protein [Obelidium mucronatum]|nr:legume-like lectin family-domain-containing protein [Obelidium mucronatum]
MALLLLLFALCAQAAISVPATDLVRTKFDYRQSFKKPFVTNPGMRPAAGATPQNSLIPHFQTNGFAHPAFDRVRVVPGTPNMTGSIWCSEPNPHREWVVTFSFASSSPPSVASTGGEGFGFWYAKQPNGLGPIYGSKDSWTGLLVGLDTAYVGRRYVPLIYGYNSEHGTLPLAGQLRSPPENLSGFLGKCYRDYRNSPHRVHARVSYIGKTLKFEMDLNQEGKGFSECFTANNVNLPIGYHFGISASTMQFVHDDHDVFHFEVHQANPPEKGFKAEENQGLPTDPEELKNIKLATSVVNEAEVADTREAYPEGFEELFSITNLQILLQNQQKIINSLNILQARLGLAPLMAADITINQYDRHADIAMNQVHGKAGDLEARVDSMIAKADVISNSIRSLSQTISSAYSSGDASMKVVAEALERKNSQLDSTVQLAQTNVGSSSAGGRGWFMYLAFFVVGGAVFVAVRNAMSSGKSSRGGSGSLGY